MLRSTFIYQRCRQLQNVRYVTQIKDQEMQPEFWWGNLNCLGDGNNMPITEDWIIRKLAVKMGITAHRSDSG
jgi:hypothetical protein